MKKYDKQFIGGKWTEGTGQRILENRNPYTNELLYSYRSASTKDVDLAFEAAQKAQKQWQDTPLPEKVGLMERLYEITKKYEAVMDECLMLEAGSAFPKRDYEIHDVPNFARYFMTFPYRMNGVISPSANPGMENYVYRKPKGIITVIAPWNVPFILAFRSILPAIATGNAVVLKPSSDTPASGMIIGEMFEEAGFPEGLLNVVCGSGSEIGDYIVEHPLSSMVSFTGSTQVGQRLGMLAGKAIKDVSLELGGNNTMIVLDDADLEAAAQAAKFSAYFNQGQVCMGLNRIVVTDKNYDEFASILAEKVKALKAGDPKDKDTFIGPVINETQAERCHGLVQSAVEAGVTVLAEGRKEGNLIYPWLLGDVTNDMPIAREEVFGPVASLIRANDEAEAVDIANDTEYGLSNSVFGKDVYHAVNVAKQLQSGMVHVNNPSIGDEPHVMFGGEKKSGIGRFNGEWVLKKFTTEQWISLQ